MQIWHFTFVLIGTLLAPIAYGQSGPFPPRLSIPGAVSSPSRSPFRNEKVVRVRRPVGLRAQNSLIPAITPRILEDPKPVTETEDDDNINDAFLPSLLREQQIAQQQQAQFQQTAAAFFNSEPNSIQEQPISHLLQPDEIIPATIPTILPASTRFPDQRQSATPSNRPIFNDYGIGSGFTSSQRFGIERTPQPTLPPPTTPQPQRQLVRSRPVLREPRPQQYQPAPQQYQPQPQPIPQAPVQVRPRPRPIPSRPIIENQIQDDREPQNRRQRPVAQTLRKWREENEDGSITWGYENDDGSFKEEIIGTDCVTKGTYGYIDPDGNKREYHYETGIKCDPNTRQTEDELEENGFINYEENKAVLPNGIEIDMNLLGKKKSKRPNINYRN